MEESKAAGEQPETEKTDPADADAKQAEEAGKGHKKPPASGPDIKWDG
ncbi:MAG: hypothetical protein LBV34_17625 [Nocardiopsaceae bacterium]|jgi:hypothetical protein|nr:hypothetical protein [Nocardiopsaceae bacterium]